MERQQEGCQQKRKDQHTLLRTVVLEQIWLAVDEHGFVGVHGDRHPQRSGCALGAACAPAWRARSRSEPALHVSGEALRHCQLAWVRMEAPAHMACLAEELQRCCNTLRVYPNLSTPQIGALLGHMLMQ